MSQETSTKDEKGEWIEIEEALVDVSEEVPQPSIDLDAISTALETLESIPEIGSIKILGLVQDNPSVGNEEVRKELREALSSISTEDLEVSRAIERIDSVQDEADEISDESETAAHQVSELYDGDRLKAMRELLEEHNLRIVQQLLASDTGALSPKEVAFRNEGIISESTVRDHLRSLTDRGFVQRLEPDVEKIPNKMPRTFYAPSPFAIELLKEMGLWENLGMLYQIYSTLDRPEGIRRIEEWEDRPHPDWI